ncbi:glycerophosphodiester phosphodiesterase family protein [candidate division KSB1 bacterium]
MIIAHRGASYDAPENTIEAVNLAWNKDADAVEVDVHLTIDGHVIVMHVP